MYMGKTKTTAYGLYVHEEHRKAFVVPGQAWLRRQRDPIAGKPPAGFEKNPDRWLASLRFGVED